MRTLLLTTILYFSSSQLLLATTIIPFANLGDMSLASDAVAVARAEENFELQQGDLTRYRTRFKVLQAVKGLPEGATFELEAWRQKSPQRELIVAGDAEFTEGKNYLLFLSASADDPGWQLMMLSYGIFEEQVAPDGQTVFVPSLQSLAIETAPRPDGIVPEPMAVFLAAPLLSHLSEIAALKSTWNSRLVAAGLSPSVFYLNDRAAPSYCSYLVIGGNNTRYTGFPGDDLEVYSEDDGDAGFSPPSAVHTQVVNAIADLEASYSGISLTYLGTLNYLPNCIGGAAGLSSNFLSTVGVRQDLIIYNDPCSQITDLVGCEGTLAIGGLFGSGTHTYDGATWTTGYNGFVIVNNGTGSCLSATNYKIMLTHEMSHSLGIGHILLSAPGGVANMNENCCNAITSFDIACVDYSYAPLLPIELLGFFAENASESVRLHWQTAAENNNAHFAIERSADGRQYEEIGELPGAGNSSLLKEYEYFDKRPRQGLNYYRLRQTDFDGRFTLSKTTAVLFGNQGETLSVSPNPVSGDAMQLVYQAASPGEVRLEVFNAAGQRVAAAKLEVETGLNFSEISLAGVPGGVLLAKAVQGGRVAILKMVKQ